MEFKIGEHYLYEEGYGEYVVEIVESYSRHKVSFKVVSIIKEHPYDPSSIGTLINTDLGWAEMTLKELTEEGKLYEL